MISSRSTSLPATKNARAAAIAIGVSSGAVRALSEILPLLPRHFPLPVLIVVHLPPGEKSALVDCFEGKCQIAIREAEDKDPIVDGTIYFAPPDYHLLVEADRRLSLSSEEPVLFSRPSIDVLFESAADVYGAALIGIILTGASNDGAGGLKAIVAAGGTALVQRPDLAQASEMPQAALDACPNALVLTLPQIANYLQQTVA